MHKPIASARNPNLPIRNAMAGACASHSAQDTTTHTSRHTLAAQTGSAFGDLMRQPNVTLALNPEPVEAAKQTPRAATTSAADAPAAILHKLTADLHTNDYAQQHSALEKLYSLTQQRSDHTLLINTPRLLHAILDAFNSKVPEKVALALNIITDLTTQTDQHVKLLSTEGFANSLVKVLTGEINVQFGLSAALTALSRLTAQTDNHTALLNTPALVDALIQSLYVKRNPYANECAAKSLENLISHRNNQATLLNNTALVTGLVYALNRGARTSVAEAAAKAFKHLSEHAENHQALNHKDLIDFFQRQFCTSPSRNVKKAMKQTLNNMGIPVKPMITLYRGVRHPQTAKKICQQLNSLPHKGRIEGLQPASTVSLPKAVTPEQFKLIAQGRGRFRNQALHTFSGFTTAFTTYTSWTTDKSLAEEFAHGMRNTSHPERAILLEITLPEDDPRIAPKKCGGAFMNALISCKSEDEYYIDVNIDDPQLNDIEVKCSVSANRGTYDTSWAGWDRVPTCP